jgi:hypothetical protein
VCDGWCRSVAGATSFCGDGNTDGANGEQCDDGNTVTEVCAYGQTACTVCTGACTSVSGATSFCGDGLRDAGNGEGCDAGLANSDAPDAACRTDCTPRRCGDGIVDGGEACDHAESNVTSCPAYVPVLPADGFCTAGCQALSCPSVGYCGDGVPDSAEGETCDAGAANGTNCRPACGADCAEWACDREWVWWRPPGDALPNAIYDTSTAGIVRDTRSAALPSSYYNAQAYCEGLTLAGFTDWRLPTLVELESLVDYSKWNPAINTTAFPGTQATDHWASAVEYLWSISFLNGNTSYPSSTSNLNVRCVR